MDAAIKDVGAIISFVEDLQRSRAFHHEVLGLDVEFEGRRIRASRSKRWPSSCRKSTVPARNCRASRGDCGCCRERSRSDDGRWVPANYCIAADRRTGKRDLPDPGGCGYTPGVRRYRDVAGRGVRHPRSPVSWTCSCASFTAGPGHRTRGARRWAVTPGRPR